MSSSSRNIPGANSARRSRVLGAGLALALCSGVGLADGAHRFVFTAYSSAAGGREVVEGRYRAALETLTRRPGSEDLNPAADDTNRCVAYSMTLQLSEARAACDAAVRAAERRRKAFPAWWGRISASDDEAVAVAHANRAVMYWMLHDAAAARRDLATARKLAPRTDAVARNLAALATHTVVAQSGAPAPQS